MGYLHTQTTLVSEAFFLKVKQFTQDPSGKIECPVAYKTTVFQDVEQVLRQGVPAEELHELCDGYTGSGKEIYRFSDFVEGKLEVPASPLYPRRSDECIQIPLFYYHPRLQETGRRPRYLMDWQTMELTYEPSESFYLEITDSFTLDDVALYFLRATDSLDDSFKVKTLSKQFVVLIQRYGLDMTLYLIDSHVMYCKENDRPMPTFPMQLLDSAAVAASMLDNRKLICKEGGLDHVHPKKTSVE